MIFLAVINYASYTICDIDLLKSFHFLFFAIKVAVTTPELTMYKHLSGCWTDLQFQFLCDGTFQNFWDDK